MGDLLELGDPELVAQAKEMATNPDKAAEAQAAKAELEKLMILWRWRYHYYRR